MPIWNYFYANEGNYHDRESTCDCRPSVYILTNGDMLYVHGSLIKEEKQFDEQEIAKVKESIVNYQH